MPKGTVEPVVDFSVRRNVPAAAPRKGAPAQVPFEVSLDMAQMCSGLGTRDEVQDELDQIAAAIRGFFMKSPDQVLRECSAYSARLTELCVLLHRAESLDRQYVRVRTMQAEKFLAEIDRQFKVASRLIEVQRQDLELIR